MKNRKPHFFRFNRTPYRVWVSEVVLQQTRMNYALPRLKKFLADFPDLTSLAEASEDDVLTSFQGLGYYNRARNLIKGARYIHKNLKGSFPETADSLLNVPSIGPYTAAAISSICFGEKKPAIDGNVKRIFARLFLIRESIQSMKLHKACEIYFQKVFENEMNFGKGRGRFVERRKPLHKPAYLPIPAPIENDVKDAGCMNEALMELGQTICLKQNPNCQKCPLKSCCLAFLEKKTGEYPVQKEKKIKKEVSWLVFIIRHGDNILLQKTSKNYFLKNQWSMPSVVFFHPFGYTGTGSYPSDAGTQQLTLSGTEQKERKSIESYHEDIPEKLRNTLSIISGNFQKNPVAQNMIKHTITNHKISIHAYILDTSQEVRGSETLKWQPLEKAIHELPSQAMQKVLYKYSSFK